MISEPSWLLRIVECFDKKTEELVSEAELPRTDLAILQRLWGMPPDEPMICGFDVSEEQAEALSRLHPELSFDFEKYDYQISAVSTDIDQSSADGGFMGEYPPPRVLQAFPDLAKVKAKSPTDS